MSIWTTNFQNLGKQNIPPRYAIPFWEAWVEVVLAPLQTLFIAFAGERELNLQFLKYDSRTLVLQWYLGQKIDTGIYIVNHPRTAKPVYDQLQESICPIVNDSDILSWIIYDAAAAIPQTDFTVYAPVAIQSPAITAQISQIVHSYKHVGITYDIIYY